MTKLGIIGLGLVGKAVAERCIAAGYSLVGFDINPECRNAFAQLGGSSQADARSVADQVDICLLSLPDSSIATRVLSDIEPLLKSRLVIDTTTGDPEASTDNARRLRRSEAGYIDATIVGSSKQVAQGDVVVLVGGDATDYEKALAVLSCFARKIFHLGACGSGARMKLVVNLVLGLNRAVLAEGLSFAKQYGIDPSEALDVLKTTAAYSKVMDTKGRKMVERDFTVEARLTQHHKDVRLILAEADRILALVPFSKLHDSLLAAAEEYGFADLDNSSIIEVFQGDRANPNAP